MTNDKKLFDVAESLLSAQRIRQECALWHYHEGEHLAHRLTGLMRPQFESYEDQSVAGVATMMAAFATVDYFQADPRHASFGTLVSTLLFTGEALFTGGEVDLGCRRP